MPQNLINSFLSQNWTMLDFCMHHDCTAEVYMDLCRQFPNRKVVHANVIVEPAEFLKGFIHDELDGQIQNFQQASLDVNSCRNKFYCEGGNRQVGVFNEVLLRRIGHFIWDSDDYERNSGNMIFTHIFSTASMFGNAMPAGFSALRRAGAGPELITKGKELSRLRYTIGNIVMLPSGCVGGRHLYGYLNSRYEGRFDLLLNELLHIDACDNQILLSLVDINRWYFEGGSRKFLSRHQMDELENDMGNAFAMDIFNRDESRTNRQAYLKKAEVFIDAAIKAIKARSCRFIEKLSLGLGLNG